MKNIRLNNVHRAIMFISTKNLPEDGENKIKGVIEDVLGDKLRFVGRCFGRFDMVAEFDERSAKVASHKVCKIQEEAAKELREFEGVGRDPICSSLMLCNEFLIDGEESVDESGHTPPTLNPPTLKLYSFLYPRKTQVNLEKVLTETKKIKENLTSVKGDANLFFSLSNYAFLLIISGNMFCKMFEQFMKFRENTQTSFLESCTYVAIGLDEKGETLKDEECENGELIKAHIFMKLKDGFGNINIRERGIIKSIDKRLGWSDISVEVEASTLHEIKKYILNLRKQHKKEITHTSTLLLPEKGGVKDERSMD